jgi:hypothetical protein
LKYNNLSTFSWDGCPSGLHTIDLSGNQLSSFSWDGCPRGLHTISLSDNQLSTLSWDGCPSGLHTIHLWDLSDLHTIHLWKNKLNFLSWDGCPLNLDSRFYFDNEYSYKEYQMAMKIKHFYKKRHARRKYSANIINSGCYNWVWKPKCKDGSIGIRPRLDMFALGIE